MADHRNPEAAWIYHDATKHCYLSIRSNPHFLDWANQPLPFKIYPAEPLPFGATDLTFYDDEVTWFFSPHAEGKIAIFLVALGKCAERGGIVWLRILRG